MEFDDKAMLKTAMKGIRAIINKQLKARNEIITDSIIRAEKNNIRNEWVIANPRYQSVAMDRYNELMSHISSLEPELYALTRDLELKCRKSLKKSEIRQAAICASLTELLNEAGYDNFSLAMQQYRIKLTVGLPFCIVVLPIKHSAFPEILEKVIPALKDAERLSSDFGRDMKIY
ncbi:MAG: hypothetical protein MJZ07_06280 [Bacteroidales bacterium]|nr:hypothetical protein [Bacteroidales bacterium]